jgi:hypothetical protein
MNNVNTNTIERIIEIVLPAVHIHTGETFFVSQMQSAINKTAPVYNGLDGWYLFGGRNVRPYVARIKNTEPNANRLK